jgi:hypothetical protein
LDSGLIKARNQLNGNFENIADVEVLDKTNPLIKDMVRFYFRPKTPAQYHFLKQEVLLVFDWCLLESNALISPQNAAKNKVKLINLSKVNAEKLVLDSMNFELTFSEGFYSNYPSYDASTITAFRNAELLIPKEYKLTPSNLRTVIFSNPDLFQKFSLYYESKQSTLDYYQLYGKVVIDKSFFNDNKNQ